MKFLFKAISLFTLIFMLPLTTAFATMSAEQSKAFVQRAVIYALQNKPINYGKYASLDLIVHVDGNTFNFVQWVKHLNDIKKEAQSIQPTFLQMIAEDNHVATIFKVNIVKTDGSKLEIKDLAFFEIKDNKIIYVDELTRLTKGDLKDKDIGSLK